jgi:hypothetical protein
MDLTTVPLLTKFNSLLLCKDALQPRIARIPNVATSVVTFLQAEEARALIQQLEARLRQIDAKRGAD